MGKLRVVQAKMLATIQDQGRFGYRKYGIPQSGAMDIQSLNHANYLVGNTANQPGVEISIQGITFQALAPTSIALTGAGVVSKINSVEVEMYQSYELITGDELFVSAPQKGVYTYLAIGGRIKGQYDFQSMATYLLAGFGGLVGTGLQVGDLLETEKEPVFQKRVANVEGFSNERVIRYVEGPESPVTEIELHGLSFNVGKDSNRTGIQLLGSRLQSSVKEITSSGVVPGTIQLLPNGLPIVLMNDCQTTGGYPRIGKVITGDLGKLAQLPIGCEFIFKKIAITEALTLG